MAATSKCNSNILMWNANGIHRKTDELLHLMESKKVSAALLSETHLQPNHKLNLANHRIYRTDRAAGVRGGGTAVIVNTGIKHQEIALPQMKKLEATGVQVQTPAGPLRLIAVYLAPNTKLHMTDLDSLLDSNIPTIIGGDLNAKHQ